MYACSEHDICVAGVCLWKKPGPARWGENVSEIYTFLSVTFYFILLLFLMYLFES